MWVQDRYPDTILTFCALDTCQQVLLFKKHTETAQQVAYVQKYIFLNIYCFLRQLYIICTVGSGIINMSVDYHFH